MHRVLFVIPAPCNCKILQMGFSMKSLTCCISGQALPAAAQLWTLPQMLACNLQASTTKLKSQMRAALADSSQLLLPQLWTATSAQPSLTAFHGAPVVLPQLKVGQPPLSLAVVEALSQVAVLAVVAVVAPSPQEVAVAEMMVAGAHPPGSSGWSGCCWPVVE